MRIFSGSDLETEREALGLTAQQLADLAGLPGGRSHVRRIERGLIDPKRATLLKLRAAMDEYSDTTAADGG